MFDTLRTKLSGELKEDAPTLLTYSKDASLCTIMPKAVILPKNAEDIKTVVSFVREGKKTDPSLSVTARAAGTCMTGGSLNDSLILDVSTYMHGTLRIEGDEATVLPGTFYRDFEKETLAKGMLLPCYTASKNLCAIGGMIGNNAGGEKTLRYGKMEKYVKSLKVVFSDGNEYEVKPLNREELDRKMAQGDFEGDLYKNLFNLLEENKEALEQAKPLVSKNSAGYYLWNVWDGVTFDLPKLIVGSQGTLGITTEATVRLIPVKGQSKLFVIFLRDLTHLSELVNEILPFGPESLESYDDQTMNLALRFFPDMLKSMRAGFLKLMWSFLPELKMMVTGGIPKLILLVEFTEKTEAEVDAKMLALQEKIGHFKFKTHMARVGQDSEKYWTIRRESFNLLRKHVRGRRTAPFVDDVIVRPEFLPEFLPKMRATLDEYKLLYTIAGHAGNGNFHIIPLMDMRDKKNIDVIMEVSEKVYDLVASYKGSITAEHNDGIIRTPYLSKMYDSHILGLFAETKRLFDPQNLFNPGKKVGGTLENLKSHLATE